MTVSGSLVVTCQNFAAAPALFKIANNESADDGWAEAYPLQNYAVDAGFSYDISFDPATKQVTATKRSSVCGQAGSSSSAGSLSSKSSSSAASVSSVPSNVAADVKTAAGSKDSRLACYKSNGEKACNLRMYQVMVESFVNGDDSINMNTGYGTSHHKGDLQGVIKSLGYIKSLGVNTLWLTPIFDSTNGGNPSQLDATGYFASNFFEVDKYFGTKDKLKELIDAAHAEGLYVLLDGVFGHVKGGAANYTTPSPGGRKLIGAANPLPYPGNLDFFKEVAAYWIANYKIDGWRLDQAYQVPVEYWDDIRKVVEDTSATVSYDLAGVSARPLGYMVGEIWDSETVIKTKGYGSEGSAGLLSAFDFPVRYSLVQTLAVEEEFASSGRGKSPASRLNEGYKTQDGYPAHAMPNLMLTNHDLVRFGDLLQRGNIANPSDDQYWGRHKAAISFMAAYSGPITLYYGDEIGQEVADFSLKLSNNVCSSQGKCDDHVSRDSGVVDGVVGTLNDKQRDLKSYVTSLMKLRQAHPALWNGSRTHIYAGTSVYMDRKDSGDDHILYALNTTNAEVRISVAASAIGASGDLVSLLNSSVVYSNTAGVYYLVLAPFEAAFLEIK
ncbi:MAG TPA: alpha-amylase family glycosyl hydrolase [Cellvibrio sp.]|nr:alpha-amylase family glycosyl hydrolase [Cellvibrio sp.]